MKKIVFGALLCSLAFFAPGCNDTAKQKDNVERTVKTDQDTGETTIKEEGEHKETDDQTGAEVETSVDKETTIKPPQNDSDENAPGDNLPKDNAADDGAAESNPPPPADADAKP